MSKQSDITVYFLGASRAIRIPFLLEELGVPYEIVFSNRAPNGVAPPEFKEKIPAPLKKSPTLQDGNLIIQESGAIAQYLIDTYDTNSKLLPKDITLRCQAYEWLHAAEGTFMLHGLAILYARWKIPEAAKEHLPEMEEGLSGNLRNDLNWLEGTLKEQRQKGHDYIVGDSLSIADVMMQFSIDFIFTRKLGTSDGDWPEVKAWLTRVMERPGYKRAVEKSGYTLDSKGLFRT